jgi:hypothetical protein
MNKSEGSCQHLRQRVQGQCKRRKDAIYPLFEVEKWGIIWRVVIRKQRNGRMNGRCTGTIENFNSFTRSLANEEATSEEAGV